MIRDICFTSDWLMSFRNQREHRAIQVNILEKMIYALYLLERLKTHGLDLVFKGGTSLVLLLDENNRFSIDIDIICNVPKLELERILDEIVSHSNFISVELDKERSYKTGIPKAHYLFEFNSIFNTKVPSRILLDILIEKSMYPELIEAPIDVKWIQTENPISVKTPSIDAITGDKLTAFAPNTVGIPYFKGSKSFAMEIGKQLFDLGQLFERIQDLKVVAQSFEAFAAQEIKYRQNDKAETQLTPRMVLEDIIETCLTIAKRDLNKEEPAKSNFKSLQNGIRAFGTGYLMKGHFRLEDALAASSKVAYLTAKIQINDLAPLAYYKSQDIKPLLIENPEWNFLNKLKRLPDKSVFYYWYLTTGLRNAL